MLQKPELNVERGFYAFFTLVCNSCGFDFDRILKLVGMLMVKMAIRFRVMIPQMKTSKSVWPFCTISLSYIITYWACILGT